MIDEHKQFILEQKAKSVSVSVSEPEPESEPESETSNDELFIKWSTIINILSEYEDGTYGVLNYFEPNLSSKMVEYLKSAEVEYHNKPNIVKKLILKNDFSAEAKNDSYGVLFIYSKSDGSIENLNKVYLLKNGDI